MTSRAENRISSQVSAGKGPTKLDYARRGGGNAQLGSLAEVRQPQAIWLVEVALSAYARCGLRVRSPGRPARLRTLERAERGRVNGGPRPFLRRGRALSLRWNGANGFIGEIRDRAASVLYCS